MNIARKIYPISRQNVNCNLFRNIRISANNTESTQATQPQVIEDKFDFEDLKLVERSERRKPRIEPFMKNVFVSKFNRDLLAYPEILNKDEYEALHQRVEKLENVFNDESKDKNDRQNALKHTSMYSAPISLTNGGLAVNTTEKLRYLEAIASDVKLAKELSDHWVCLEALKLGLSEEDYQKLYPELMTGESLISLCIKDPLSTRVLEPDFKTTARLDAKGIWVINGVKECIDAKDYLLVLCSLEVSRMMAFLVHPNAEGIDRRGNTILFRNTPGIPLSNIPDARLSSVLGLSRLQTATLSHSVLKQALKYAFKMVRGKYVGGKPLTEFTLLQSRIGEVLLTIYASESASYYTAGLLDGYESPDAELEMALCRNFMSHCGYEMILKLQSLPGLQTDDGLSSFMNSLRYLFCDESDDITNMYIALTGIQHAGKMMADEVKQMRNPLFHPGFILKKLFADRHQDNDDPKLTLRLAEHLHPSLKQSSDLLEYAVLRMRFASETLLARYGTEVVGAFTELERISLAATEIYAMASVLARASRSYCIGLRNAEMDMKYAATFVERSKLKTQKLIRDIDDGEYLNLDHFKLHLGRKAVENTDIVVSKPYDRTFW